MGQTIDVLMYGARVPEGKDMEDIRAKYDVDMPNPDDADPDEIIGFFICKGAPDRASSHQFPAMSLTEMRRREPTASIIRECQRRWATFAEWARTQGVEFGKPRIWRTRTEVA